MIIHERQNSLVSKYESATCDEMNDFKSRIQASEENEDMLRRITEKENTHCKPFSLFIVIIVFLINISKGTPKVQSPFGVEACSLADYILFAAFMVFLILMAAISIFIAKEEYIVKRDCQYEFYEGDIVWTSKMIIQIYIFSLIIGLITSLVGLGRGAFFSSLFLSYGISPIVASATGMYMVMFSNISSCLLYAFSGVLDIPLALWLGSFSLVGTIIGIKVINAVIKNTGKTYYIVIILAGIIVISTIEILIFGIVRTLNEIYEGIDVLKFEPFC